MTSQSRGAGTNEGLVVSILGQLTRLHAHQADEAHVVLVPCAARTFISLAISRSRCYIGPSDLTSRSVLSDFLFSLLNLSRVRHSHAIKQRLGRH